MVIASELLAQEPDTISADDFKAFESRAYSINGVS